MSLSPAEGTGLEPKAGRDIRQPSGPPNRHARSAANTSPDESVSPVLLLCKPVRILLRDIVIVASCLCSSGAYHGLLLIESGHTAGNWRRNTAPANTTCALCAEVPHGSRCKNKIWMAGTPSIPFKTSTTRPSVARVWGNVTFPPAYHQCNDTLFLPDCPICVTASQRQTLTSSFPTSTARPQPIIST